MTALVMTGDDRLRTATCGDARWLVHAQLWRPRDPDELTTGDHETAVVLLGGTFDLVGGHTAWPARGTRSTPFTGRPMAVYLPKHTRLHVSRGQGEILLVGARQPVPGSEATGRDGLAQKPLLPLAGSGKAFDPKTGDWLPAEAFPSAAESLPPRRFERVPVGPHVLERVFAPDYKAATLSLDEVVLPGGTSLALADVPKRPACDEVLLFVRGDATLHGESGPRELHGDTVCVLPGQGGAARLTAHGECYVVLAWAGKGS